LAPLAIGVAVVGLIIGMFTPPPPPPPSGPQLVCQNLVTQGIASSVQPAPPPPSFSSNVYRTTNFVVTGSTPSCLEFTPPSGFQSVTWWHQLGFSSADVDSGPCSDIGYFVMATDCLLDTSGGGNSPYTSSFPPSPPAPSGEVSLGAALSGVKYTIWLKPFTQQPPAVSYPGRRLLGSSGGPSPPSGPTTMFLYSGSGSSVCGEFTTPQSSQEVQNDYALTNSFNIGTCKDHGFYTLLSSGGQALEETFTSGWGQGTKYRIWVKNAVCGNLPAYTPNFYGLADGRR